MKADDSGNWSTEKIERLLSSQSKIDLMIMKAFGELKAPYTVLALIDSKQYPEIKEGLMDKFIEEKHEIIYITVNTVSGKIVSELEARGKNTEKIHFIDLISMNSGAKAAAKAKNVSYLSSPSELTECILLAEKKLHSLKGKDTLVLLDSISTMLVYNEEASIEKFMHILLGKIDSVDSSAVILSTDVKEKEWITRTLGQFVDKTITLFRP
ncbi:MAG TPA: hypothetical protein VFF09_02320 [archaeon]|nr:hypothetical protein [archaeon]